MYSGEQEQVHITEPSSLFSEGRRLIDSSCSNNQDILVCSVSPHSPASLLCAPGEIRVLILVQIVAYPWLTLSSFCLFARAASLFWFPAFTPNTDGELWFIEAAGLC